MRFGSLFSGVGGFDLGFEQAGHECAWQVEFDESCQRVLRRRFRPSECDQQGEQDPGGFIASSEHPARTGVISGPVLHSDVREVGAHNLTPVDLVCGGFPCQDLSVAGKRAGLDGDRSGLWFEFHRILAEIRPRWVVIENVPGLLSSNGGADMAVVLGGLGELGYGWAFRVLDAQHFGVAQRRRRVFIVGHLGEPWSAAPEVLFEPESCGGYPPTRREAGEGVAGTLGGGSGERGWPQDTERMTFVPTGYDMTTETATARSLASPRPGAGGGYRADLETETMIAHSLTAGGFDASEDGTGRGTPLVAQWDGRRANDVQADVVIANTLDGDGRDGVATMAAVRRLTPTECERLQGFPDGWTFGSDSTRYRQLGNAVAVPVAAWLGRRLMEFS